MTTPLQMDNLSVVTPGTITPEPLQMDNLQVTTLTAVALQMDNLLVQQVVHVGLPLQMDNLQVTRLIFTGPPSLRMDDLTVIQLGALVALQMDNLAVASLPVPAPAKLAMDNFSVATATPVPDLVWLEWSDDRGHSWGNPVSQPIGAAGKYLTSLQWQRLGYARDRVFRLTWSASVPTALQGAWIQVDATPTS